MAFFGSFWPLHEKMRDEAVAGADIVRMFKAQPMVELSRI